MRRIAIVFFLGLIALSGLKAQINTDSLLIKTDSIQLQSDTLLFPVDSLTALSRQMIDSLMQDSSYFKLNAKDSVITKVDGLSDDGKGKLEQFFFPKDSLDIYQYSFFPDSINYTNLKFLDTSNHDAAQFNPSKLFDVSFIDLGPIGSAHQNQIFTPSSKLGFNQGIHAYDAFLWTEKDLKLYDNRTPYTKAFYLMGSKKENVLKLSHAQSFFDQQVTAQFDFQLYNHLGFYERQHSDTKSFKGGLGYKTKDKRYQAHFMYYHNKMIYEENGGINNLLYFEEDRETNRQIIPINLENAENLIRISGVSLKQDFYISKPEPDLSEIPDTNTIQFEQYSVIHYQKPWFAPVSHLGKISYHFNYQRENYKYTDSDQNSVLYDSIPQWSDENAAMEYFSLPYFPTADSSEIFDSLTVRKYTNEIIYSNTDYTDDALHPKFLNYFVGLRNEFTYWNQACFNTKEMRHNALIGGVFFNLSNILSVIGDAEYYIGDYSNNDFQINGKINLMYRGNKLSGGIKVVYRMPDYIYQEFTSSRLRWNNDFGKTSQQELFVGFDRKNLYIKAKVLNISNYVYFNELYQPTQFGGNIQHIVIEARKDIRLGYWGADMRLVYQTVSQANVIRVPELTGKARLFYHRFLFNDVLEAELGVQVNYFTEYYADRYLPLLRSWHIQNAQKIGNYPFADVYFNAKIGKARLFVRYENFNANFMDNTYYASPSYPGLDSMFRFGISWVLFN